MELGNNLRKFRLIDAEMTQKELAEKIGVSRQTIHAIEKSKFNPSIKLSLEIAQFFGVPVEDIFYLKEEEK